LHHHAGSEPGREDQLARHAQLEVAQCPAGALALAALGRTIHGHGPPVADHVVQQEPRNLWRKVAWLPVLVILLDVASQKLPDHAIAGQSIRATRANGLRLEEEQDSLGRVSIGIMLAADSMDELMAKRQPTEHASQTRFLMAEPMQMASYVLDHLEVRLVCLAIHEQGPVHVTSVRPFTARERAEHDHRRVRREQTFLGQHVPEPGVGGQVGGGSGPSGVTLPGSFRRQAEMCHVSTRNPAAFVLVRPVPFAISR
jgi:hypothetical protein